MKYLIYLLTFCITYLANSQSKIDGFYRGKNNATVVIGYGYEDSKNYFIGTEKSNLSRSLTYINLFASYGISNNLDIQVSLPYLESDNNKSLQDISFFSKYRILKKQKKNGQFELSSAIGFSTPVNDYSIGGLYDLGQQATVIDLRLMLHYLFNSQWFFTVQSGYSFKLEEVPNSIPFGFKVGIAASKYYFDAYYDYQYAIGGIDYRGTPSPQNFRELAVNFHKVGTTFYYRLFNNFGSYVSYSYVLDGRNTFTGPSYGIGLSYDFKK